MPVESHVLMDGALHVYKREGSRFWQCATYLGSRNHRQTTKETSLAAAKDFARDWYMERCVEDRQRRRGGVPLINGSAQPAVAEPGPAVVGLSRPAPASRMRRRPSPASSRSSRWASATQAM
jgi:hypothetical protein